MLSQKRKLASSGLQRRVRPRREVEIDSEPDVEEDSNSGEESDSGASNDSASEDEDGVEGDSASEDEEGGEEEEDEDDDDSTTEDAKPSLDLTSISFGDLAQAQASISKSRSKSKSSPPPTKSIISHYQPEDKPRPKVRPPKRTSKHAPTEMSASRPVSRKRDFAETTAPKHRDPRFDALSGQVDEDHVRRAYSFLDDYRDDEIRQMRATLKKTRDPALIAKLKRDIASLQSRRETEKRKDAARQVHRDHKRAERELVQQGKQPFFLKKSEEKKRVLIRKFEGMSEKQVDHAVERRRKKQSAREKKELVYLERAGAARAGRRG